VEAVAIKGQEETPLISSVGVFYEQGRSAANLLRADRLQLASALLSFEDWAGLPREDTSPRRIQRRTPLSWVSTHLFLFEKPTSRNFTETVRTLAHFSRFIIADLADPSSIPQELQAIIPTLAVPFLPYNWLAKIMQVKETSAEMGRDLWVTLVPL
jgi:hypothetical protein